MKAITIHQPWADLIAAGTKTIETRTWPTQFRGVLAIHAGKKSCSLLAVGGQPEAHSEQRPGEAAEFWCDSSYRRREYGAVVAVARMFDCRRLTAADEAAACCECAGKFGFFLRDVMRLRHPMKLRGQQGLREINEPGTDYLMRLYAAFLAQRKAASANTEVVVNRGDPVYWDEENKRVCAAPTASG